MKPLCLAAVACAALAVVPPSSRADVGKANAGFEAPFDATDKAKAACGLAAIDYRGIDRDWAPPSQTTPERIFSRDLMAWCRAYGPMSGGGGRLTVTFKGADALVRNIEATLADQDRTITRRFEYYQLLGFTQFVETAYEGPRFLLQVSHDLVAQGKPRRKARELYNVLCNQPWGRPFGALELPEWSEPGSILRAQPISHYGFAPEATPPLTEGGGYRPGISTFRRAGMMGGWRGRTDADRQFISTTVTQKFIFSDAPCAPPIQAAVAAESPYDSDLNTRVAKAYANLNQAKGSLAGLAEVAAPRSVCERTIIGADGAQFNTTGFSSAGTALRDGAVSVGLTFLHMVDGRYFLSTTVTLSTDIDRPDARCRTAIFS